MARALALGDVGERWGRSTQLPWADMSLARWGVPGLGLPNGADWRRLLQGWGKRL